MPLYNVKAPDGSIIPVNAPEGATEQQAIEFAAATWKPTRTQPAQPAYDEQAELRKIIESEPSWKQALLGAGGGLVKTALGAKQLFSPLTEEQQGAVQAATTAQEVSPWAGAAGDIATMVAPGLGAVKLASKAPILARMLPSTTRAAEAVGGALMAPKTLGQAAAGGAAYLGLQPTQGAEADLGERAWEAGKGAALGGVGYGAVKGLATLLNPQLARQVTEEGVKRGVPLGALTPVQATSEEAARMELLKKLPVPITEKDVIRSQITRKYPQQEAERLIAGQPIIGTDLSAALERGQDKMMQNIEAYAKKTGAKAPTEEAAGDTFRSWMQNIYGAAKEDTNKAYEYARQLHGEKQFYPEDSIVKALAENRSLPGYRELYAQAKNMGIIVPKEGGGITAGRVTVNDLDKFKSMANNVAQSSDGMTRYAGGDIVNKVYSQIDNVAPEFREAAAMRKRQGQIFEAPKVAQKILGMTSGKFGGAEKELGGITIPDYKVPSEKLVSSILSGGVEDLRYIRNLAATGTKEQKTMGVQAIREMRGSVIEGMKDVWTKTQTSQSKANQLNKYFERLGDDKIEILFGKSGAKQISDFRKAAEIMNKAVPSPEGGSQTAGRLMLMAGGMFKFLERLPIVGATTAKAAGIVKDIGTASAAKRIPSTQIPYIARRPELARSAANRLADLAGYGALGGVGAGQMIGNQ